MYPISSNDLNKETDDAVYFFTPAFYPLDNFSAHTVKIWGKTFLTAEHAYQWKKYSADSNISEAIWKAGSPHIVKEIADQSKTKVEAKWHENKVAVMEEILRAKVEQHEDVRDILKRTGNRMIIENSPIDTFWGAGPDGTGENQLGKIWMKIRDQA